MLLIFLSFFMFPCSNCSLISSKNSVVGCPFTSPTDIYIHVHIRKLNQVVKLPFISEFTAIGSTTSMWANCSREMPSTDINMFISWMIASTECLWDDLCQRELYIILLWIFKIMEWHMTLLCTLLWIWAYPNLLIILCFKQLSEPLFAHHLQNVDKLSEYGWHPISH
jgi:hypothetical protein